MLPILYQNHNFILYAYPLLMGLGWGVAYQVFFSKLDTTFSTLKAQILFWGIFISSWIGAKVLFYLTFPENMPAGLMSSVNFWTGGGFVFYGGFIGSVIFILFYKKLFQDFKFEYLWAIVPALALGHGIGRIGCFLAGCCYGKPTELAWGIFLHNHNRHPTQLIEACGLLILGLYLFYSKNKKRTLIAIYLLGYGILRFGVESLRGDLVRGLWGPFTPSEWISFILIISGLYLLLYKKTKIN